MPKLLPPSTFEVSKDSNPWEDLAKVTSEVILLKQENIKLRDQKSFRFTSGEEIKARVDVHQASPNITAAPVAEPVGIKHLDEIISRQASDIAELRKQLAQEVSSHQKENIQLHGQLELQNMQYKQRVSSLEEQLSNMQTTYQQQLAELMTEKEKDLKKENAEKLLIHDQLITLQKQSQSTIAHIQDQLAASSKQVEINQQEIQATTRTYKQTIAEQEIKIQQLKKYLSESQDVSQSTEVWRKQLYELKSKLEHSEKEKQKSETSIDLLNIRLTSQNEILRTHEADLSKVKESSADKKKHSLLTRWRQKVYQLLVQLKTQEIVLKDQEGKWINKTQQLKIELNSSRSHNQMMQHALSDKQAELDLQINQNQNLEQNLSSAQQLALSLDDQLKSYEGNLEELANFSRSLWEQYLVTHEHLNKTLVTLKAYNQRITFASGRVELLQSQFSRKEALLRMQLKDELQNEPTRDTDDVEQSADSLYDQLCGELERVTSERDQLAAQVRQDSNLMEHHVSKAQAQYAEEVEQLRKRHDELHSECDTTNQKCDSLRSQLEESQSEIIKSNEVIEQLKTALAKVNLDAEKTIEAARSTEEAKFLEQLADMEHKMNEARREHTKAVVSLRQQERAYSREKERGAEANKLQAEQYEEQVRKLQYQLKQSDSDRNMLLATLRQEGVISKHKLQRQEPAQLAVQSEEQHDTTIQQSENTTSQCHLEQDKEPLHAVIDDLKSLTAAILEDDSP